MKKYSLLLFDADDTLFDYKKAAEKAIRKTFIKFGLDYSPEIYTVYETINAGIWAELEQGLISQEKLKSERFRRLGESLSVRYDENDFSINYQNFLAESDDLIDFAGELLEYLSDKYIISVITNGLKEVQLPRIGNSSINQFISQIIISEDVGFAKPDKKIFEYAMNISGHNIKEEVLMIGDNINADIRGGNDFGIDTCWLNPEGKNAGAINPTYTVSHLRELKEIL